MFPLISGSVMHPFIIVYALIAVMILHYRYCHLCFNNIWLRPALSFLAHMRKRHARAANLATQRNVHWRMAWSLHAYTRVMSYTIAPAYTKLASSAARAALPTTVLWCSQDFDQGGAEWTMKQPPMHVQAGQKIMRSIVRHSGSLSRSVWILTTALPGFHIGFFCCGGGDFLEYSLMRNRWCVK